MTLYAGEVLEQCRTLFGVAPRTFDRRDRKKYLRLVPPRWVRKDAHAPLQAVIADQDRLLEQGRVVWGCIVQANTLLFKEGRHDSPAKVLYSPDPALDDRPDLLAEVAERLFALKGTHQADAELQKISQMLANEMEDGPHLPVPRSLAGSLPLFASTILVSRRHLPGGVLRGRQFPLIIHPELDSTMILPSRYWAQQLVQAWGDPRLVG